MHLDPTAATAFIATIVVIVTAGIAAYMHLLPMVTAAIDATKQMLEDIGALKTTTAVHATQIQAHEKEINGAMQGRIQAVIDRSTLAAAAPLVAANVPGGRRASDGAPVAVVAPVTGVLSARIAALQAEIDAAKRLGADVPTPPQP